MMSEDSWKIKQTGFSEKDNRFFESIMSTGNGEMGARGNFEEQYSGDSLGGRYIGGVYYNDKTRVGWWKNGYPEYFAKIVNCPDFLGLEVKINSTEIDLAKINYNNFTRELDMRNGVLRRSFDYTGENGAVYHIRSQRFFSLSDPETALLQYSVTSDGEGCELEFSPFINADVYNEESNYGERFFDFVSYKRDQQNCAVCVKTKKTGFLISSAFAWQVSKRAESLETKESNAGLRQGLMIKTRCESGETVAFTKYITVMTSLNHSENDLDTLACAHANSDKREGYARLCLENDRAWKEIWRTGDVSVDGDIAAQIAIRYSIFQLNCSYSGAKEHLNVGPKGFTGEKYGGGVYWDNEAYCIYFYLGTRRPEIARKMLLYRFCQLDKAKENAKKLGLLGALYPMVAMNGEECHNEWEITFEELHRNSAIAFAIKNYTDYTGDREYLKKYGIDVLVEICRFWASRVSVGASGRYMILGVTGPNEYENNVNNNWYTNRMTKWCFEYTLSMLEALSAESDGEASAKERLSVNSAETEKWKDIAKNMYLPYDNERRIFLQQDGFLDKEIIAADLLPAEDRPLNKHWSWDRILRSCYIKQADVLQGLWFLDDLYSLDEKKRNFDFYEPLTVHESSLSPSVHAIIASEIGYIDKAYEMFMHTVLLDLNNVNSDTSDGLHITSMAGSWMSVVYGFGGIRIKDGELSISPVIPKKWESYAFHLYYRNTTLRITVTKDKCTVEAISGDENEFTCRGEKYSVKPGSRAEIAIGFI